MKNTKKCTKCNSDDLLVIPGILANYGHGNIIFLEAKLFGLHEKISRYLCLKCGYIENWIDSFKDIEKLRKLYKKPE